MAKLELTNHAKERLSQRGISRKRVREVIQKDNSPSNTKDGKLKASHKGNYEKPVTVIYKEKTKNKALIITAYHGY